MDLKKLIAAIAVVFLFTSLSLAQTGSGSASIEGTILDPTSKPVSNAAVVVRNEASAAENKTATDTQGKFSVTDLPVGNYTVDVAAPGFALASRPGVKAT